MELILEFLEFARRCVATNIHGYGLMEASREYETIEYVIRILEYILCE